MYLTHLTLMVLILQQNRPYAMFPLNGTILKYEGIRKKRKGTLYVNIVLVTHQGRLNYVPCRRWNQRFKVKEEVSILHDIHKIPQKLIRMRTGVGHNPVCQGFPRQEGRDTEENTSARAIAFPRFKDGV